MTQRSCESASSVEHFFNVVFSEFQSHPPACVCVQMCQDQATYCYPNNCFKPINKRKNDQNPISKIDGHKTQPIMFLIEHEKELFDIFEDRDSKGRTERPVNEFILRPNPFKELVLKHKRLPKLEMRYNLREQVKNTKSDKLKGDGINLSKTRWPLNKQVFHSKQPRSEIKHFKGNDDTRQTKFFASMFSEHEPLNFTPKYLKKYLTKRENGDVNSEALYLYKTESANFSLETLIDNMIDKSLDENVKNATLDLNVYINNENVISLNSSKETVDRNKYQEDFGKQDLNKSVIELIEKMSQEIDKQNNISIEIVEKLTGSKVESAMSGMPLISIDINEVEDSHPTYEVAKRNSITDNATTLYTIDNTLDSQEISTTSFKPIASTSKIMNEESKQRNRIQDWDDDDNDDDDDDDDNDNDDNDNDDNDDNDNVEDDDDDNDI
ncbi:activating signal cointegrator 1 complex subunit 3-like [Zerene cesonia]|uniref:activating signal cointegrator 1 complex subunit 3-like n=1 Tax=Zerene cesonia TaxID=33412 RepID=UPI0018E56E01|nr:activating signal cointegrator 1 complex subunit 3-like [Zerene cesonia]